MNSMKLLRPLHRQRTRRRTKLTVLGNEDLAAHYCVTLHELEAHLLNSNLPFHKDSRGNIWASCEVMQPVAGADSAERS